MNKTEVAALLALLNKANPLNTFDESKVDVWFVVLNDQAPGLDASWVMRWASKRVTESPDVTLPNHVIKAWNDHRSYQHDNSIARGDLEAHCGFSDCRCTHTGGCYKGWLDGDHAVAPCPVCRTSLSLVLQEVAPLGSRTQADHQRIRTRDSDA